MRYARAKSSDWVEIKGADALTMRELMVLFNPEANAAYTLAAQLVVDSHFQNKAGEWKIDSPEALLDLTPKQWDWLRARIVESARDEELDPEA